MDISALSESDFNAAEWINTSYKKYVQENAGGETANGSDTALAFINSYVPKLQLYVQQVNFAVEESSQQLVASMPRIAKEGRALQVDVQQLQQRMNTMRQEVAMVQEETGDCMASLERLNTLQTKLQSAKESLQESDGWGNLIAELEDSLERNDLKIAYEKLVALQKSLQAQEQLAGHSERQTQVEDLKNRLEALASPNVVQCFAEINIEQAKSYVSIFSSIKRLPQLQQYYRAVQKNALQQQWKQTLELQSTESMSQQQHFLTLFYDNLLEHCRRQVKWCAQVFTDDMAIMQPIMIVAELLPGLQPTRDAHILQLLKTSNERLELLQQYAQANHAFAVHLNAFLEQSSIRLSDELRLAVGEAIYEYFYKFIQQYPRLEETHLSTQVDRLIANQSSVGESVRHVDDSVRKVFEWLTEACQRCQLITSDLALIKLIGLLGGIFKRLLENFAKTQRQLRLSIGQSAGAEVESWSLLQYTMSLLQCLADFQLKLNKFEKMLHERMASLADKLHAQSAGKAPPIDIYSNYDAGEQKRLLASIAELQRKRSEMSNSQVDSLGIFEQIYEALKLHFSDTHDIALSILLQPIEAQLIDIEPSIDPNGGNPSVPAIEMPAFSFTPQECITQIGQYLLTLPQHLEPLLLSPSSLLKQALEVCNIKYTQSIPSADIMLSLVVEQCCLLYQTQLLQIKTLSPMAARQVSVDIEYLASVIEELGLSINAHLSQIRTLLNAPPENYLALSSGCEPRLVTAIRQMRNIMSTQ